VLDCSPALDRTLRTLALGAISTYALARNIRFVRVVTSGVEICDRQMVAAEDLAAQAGQSPPGQRGAAVLQPAAELLEKARDFPPNAPILFLNGTPCDRVRTGRDHCFVIPEGCRLPFKTDAPVIEIGT
jgi:hypothetical protein